jgi:hypothetical protein
MPAPTRRSTIKKKEGRVALLLIEIYPRVSRGNPPSYCSPSTHTVAWPLKLGMVA